MSNASITSNVYKSGKYEKVNCNAMQPVFVVFIFLPGSSMHKCQWSKTEYIACLFDDHVIIITSSPGPHFHIACPLCGDSHDHRWIPGTTLQWRHNEHDSVSNYQPHDCLLNRFFGRRSKKTSKLRVTGLCVGNSPGTGEFPAQRASNVENVSIWWRHHESWWYIGLVVSLLLALTVE